MPGRAVVVTAALPMLWRYDSRTPRNEELSHAGESPEMEPGRRTWNYESVSSPRLQWAVGGFFAAWAVARLTAADRFAPLERAAVPLLSLSPQVAAGAGLAALALRRTGPAATAALAGTALAATLAPRLIPSRQPPAGGPVLRVLTVNMHYGKAAGPGIVGLARRSRPTCCSSRSSATTAAPGSRQPGSASCRRT